MQKNNSYINYYEHVSLYKCFIDNKPNGNFIKFLNCFPFTKIRLCYCSGIYQFSVKMSYKVLYIFQNRLKTLSINKPFIKVLLLKYYIVLLIVVWNSINLIRAGLRFSIALGTYFLLHSITTFSDVIFINWHPLTLLDFIFYFYF
jgi:hypothetical protein